VTARARRALIALLLVLSGSALTLFIEHVIVGQGRTEAGASAREHAAVLAQMERSLDLTAAQRDSIQVIFSRHQARVDSGWNLINQQMRATMDSVHTEIQRVLKPEQLGAFHELMRQQHRGNPQH
jgi:hypothetical protein